jgi:hypothetical protein
MPAVDLSRFRRDDMLDDMDAATLAAGRRMAEDLGDRFKHNIEINTPVETRLLRDSYRISPIHYRPVPGLLGFMAYAWEGTVFTEVEYAPYVEHGTGLWGPKRAKYKIEPKEPGGVLAFAPYMRNAAGGVILDVAGSPSRGNTVFTRHVMHPGSPGAAMFRIGAVITEAEADEWSYQALRMWERAVRSPSHLPVVDADVRIR